MIGSINLKAIRIHRNFKKKANKIFSKNNTNPLNSLFRPNLDFLILILIVSIIITAIIIFLNFNRKIQIRIHSFLIYINVQVII